MAFDREQYKLVESQVYSMTAAAYDKYGSATFQEYARPLIDAAGLRPGLDVLDVACGPGIPSLMVAPMVAPGGRVTGIDLAPGMVELAERKAGEAGIDNVSFRQADAESMPFDDGSFDVVLCNHGLVHMTDRMGALGEMRRVLKVGGCLAVSVWSAPDKSAALGIVAKRIAELFPAAIVPGAPGWFDFGTQGSLEKSFAMAGFREIEVAKHILVQEMEDGRAYWEAVTGISGRLQMLLKKIPPEVGSKIEEEVIRRAETFRVAERIRIPCEELWCRARK